MIFKPKGRPILRWSRVCHFLLAATVTAYGGHLWGYEGSALSGGGMILVGFGWELWNRFSGKGPHPYADYLDFLAFVAGAVVSGLGFNILEVL